MGISSDTDLEDLIEVIVSTVCFEEKRLGQTNGSFRL